MMLNRNEFVRISTDINLFFQRIMMEHLYLIETNLQPVQEESKREASRLKEEFARLLTDTVNNSIFVSEEVLESAELVTPYTKRAEEITSIMTGSSIDTEITEKELRLRANPNPTNTQRDRMERALSEINERAMKVLNETINFKTRLYNMITECRIFMPMYNEMLEHLIHEAVYYRQILEALQARRRPEREICEEFNFWNHIMSEHAQFMDGMLDPSEKSLKENARTFADIFENLVERCMRVGERQTLQSSLTSTARFREFKQAATEGLLDCKIKAVILPILADHVLREANHYQRLLQSMKAIRHVN